MLETSGLQTAPVDHSIVIPIFNEEETLPELYRRLTAVMGGVGGSYEIILVDDGSHDRSFPIMRELHQQDARVKALRFSRNFGHHMALTAGIDYAAGRAVILMDGDLQDQPEEIPRLLAKLAEGYDIVHGLRVHRKGHFVKRTASRLFVAATNRVIGSGQPINSEIFRVMDRRVVDELKRCREVSRFVTGLVSWLGFRQVGVDVEHGARYAGRSKYNVWKLVMLALNTFTSFSYFPLQLASYVGFLTAIASLVGGIYLICLKLAFGIPVPGYASFLVAILFLGGIQLIMLGIIGEYVGRIYTEAQDRPLYVIRERLT